MTQQGDDEKMLLAIWSAIDDAVVTKSGWDGHSSSYYPEAFLESLRAKGYDVAPKNGEGS